MSKDTSSEHLRAELKNLADTLEEVLSSSTEKSKASWINFAIKRVWRWIAHVNVWANQASALLRPPAKRRKSRRLRA